MHLRAQLLQGVSIASNHEKHCYRHCVHMYSAPLGKSQGTGLLGGTWAVGIRECEYLWAKASGIHRSLLGTTIGCFSGYTSGLLGAGHYGCHHSHCWLPLEGLLSALSPASGLHASQVYSSGWGETKVGLPMVPLKAGKLVTHPVLPLLVKGTLSSWDGSPGRREMTAWGME